MNAENRIHLTDAMPAPTSALDLLAFRPPRFFPTPVVRLLRAHTLHPVALEGLAALTKRRSVQLWGLAADDVVLLPEPLRSLDAQIARYFARSIAEPRVERDLIRFGRAITLNGKGKDVALHVLTPWQEREFVTPSWMIEHHDRQARLELRQLIAAINGFHRPYCTPELFHADGSYANFTAQEVNDWVEHRIDELAIQVFAHAKQLALKRRRQLGRLQAVNDLGKLVLIARAERAKQASKKDERLVAKLLIDSPLAFQWACISQIEPKFVALALEQLPDSLTAKLQRNLVNPLGEYPVPQEGRSRNARTPEQVTADLESAIRIRSALLAAGPTYATGWEFEGWNNIAQLLERYRKIPGANDVFSDPTFVLAPLLRGAPTDLRSEFYERLVNTLPDAIRWSCLPERAAWVAPALLAMTFAQLNTFTRVIHEVVAAHLVLPRESSIQAHAIEPFMAPFAHGDCCVVDLDSEMALEDEGRRMDHCSGTYVYDVARRLCRVVSIRQAETSVGTLEIVRRGGQYTSAQLVSIGNTRPLAHVRAAAKALLDALNSKRHEVNASALREYHNNDETLNLDRLRQVLSEAWLRERLAPWLDQKPIARMRRWS